MRTPAKRRCRARPFAKARTAWMAQGRYLGTLRRLSRADRARVKAVRGKKGVRAAIAAARRLSARS